MKLTSKQRAFLKRQAHTLSPMVRIGKDGLQEAIVDSIFDAMSSRELLKIKILQNCEQDRKEIYKQLLEVEGLTVVDMIGRTIVVYKENKDKPTISLELKYVR